MHVTCASLHESENQIDMQRKLHPCIENTAQDGVNTQTTFCEYQVLTTHPSRLQIAVGFQMAGGGQQVGTQPGPQD